MKILTASFWRQAWPGLVVATLLALAASAFGDSVSWLGGAGMGILAGVFIASIVRLPARLVPGFSAAGKQILQCGVIFLGAGLNLAVVWRTGLATLSLMLITISAVFLFAWVLGKFLHIPANHRDLIASGTAICGGSAIAAIAPVIGAKDEEISYSISVVFLFNIMAVVLFPALGFWLGLDAETFGIWAGTAVNDTSSVMASSFAFSADSVPTATLVKMTRTVMIVPMALIFSFVVSKRIAAGNSDSGGAFCFTRVFPWFVLGFLLMSCWTTWGGLPADWANWCKAVGKFLIVVALSGIGLNTDLRKILATGIKPIVLGACLWFVVAALGLALIVFMRLGNLA